MNTLPAASGFIRCGLVAAAISIAGCDFVDELIYGAPPLSDSTNEALPPMEPSRVDEIVDRRTNTEQAQPGARVESEQAPEPVGPRNVPPECEPEDARPFGSVRLGTWNIRWFPDGAPHGPSERMTDLDRLACNMVRADVDAWSLQEILLHRRGRWAMDTLKTSLTRMTGHRWEFISDACDDDDERQHVAILYDATRARLTQQETLPWLNGASPTGDGCGERLRPGLAALLDFYHGPDLWLVSLHLDSGRAARDYNRRTRSIDGLGLAIRVLRNADRDIVFAGDFNVMGSDAEGFPGSNHAELSELDRRIEDFGLRRLRVEPGCTEFHGHDTSMLDHVLATISMRELPGANAQVLGACAVDNCREPDDDPDLARVSDHCPVIFDVSGTDDD